MPEPRSDPPPSPPPTRFGRLGRALRAIKPRRLLHLSLREYLPAVLTISLWAIILAAIGHADTARLFAATVTLRAIQMFTRLSTAGSLKARIGAPNTIRKQARRLARLLQLAVLAVNIILIAGLAFALAAIGQDQVAFFLPLVAVGMPARILRYSDVRTDSPYFRLALSSSGLVMAVVGWAAGLGAVGMGLAFGMREWVAFGVIRYWPKAPHVPAHPNVDPLTFAEVARNTAVSARRLLTYRMTKIEPYLPHRLSGFMAMIVATAGGAIFLVLRSGEPAAMIGAAGLMQVAGASANIALLWHYLPNRRDPNLKFEDDDDE